MSIDPPLYNKRRTVRRRAKAPAPPPKKSYKRYYAVGGGLLVGIIAIWIVLATLKGKESFQPIRQAIVSKPESSVVVQKKIDNVQTVSIIPSTAIPGDKVTASIYPDPSSLPGNFSYQWYCDGQSISGAESSGFDTSTLKKGDNVFVEVVQRIDGAEKARVRSSSLVLRNRAPVILSTGFGSVANGLYQNEIQATDPDGDKISYSFLRAPEGMTIDAEAGKILWPLPAGQSGVFEMEISASDGFSAAYKKMTVTLGGGE